MGNKSLKSQLMARFYDKNRLLLGLASFSAIIAGLVNLILSWILKQLVDIASGVPAAPALDRIVLISVGFIFLCNAVFLVNYLSVPAYLRRALCQYKELAFQKLIEKNIASFRDESTATYLSALTNDVTSIEANYLEQQFSLITQTVAFFGAFGLMLWYSPLMTAVAIGVTILPLIASLLAGNRLELMEKKISERNKGFTASLQECLSGFSVIKSFKAEQEIYRLFVAENQSLENEKFSKQRLKNLIGMIGAITGICAQLGVFIIGTWLAISGHALTGGTVILFVNLMNFIIQPIAEIPGLLANRKAARGLIAKLAEALNQNPTTDGLTDISALQQGLELQHVSFGYETDKEVLHDVSTTFVAGKAYAVVGGSGSGKSTLLHLLMGGSTAYSGEIFYDDVELRTISARSLYEVVAVIQQNVFVFHASIRDNITMFREFPQHELDAAIGRAHLSDFLQERGDDFLCGENGNALSGGEKQRISIARSLLKNANLLLADEATAALDAQTAHQVTSDLLDLQGITRIVVTHALEEATLRRYDGILVMKDGRIEENGSFDELMSKKGYFYALFTVAQ